MAYTAGLHDLWRTCVAFEKWKGLSKPAAASVSCTTANRGSLYVALEGHCTSNCDNIPSIGPKCMYIG